MHLKQVVGHPEGQQLYLLDALFLPTYAAPSRTCSCPPPVVQSRLRAGFLTSRRSLLSPKLQSFAAAWRLSVGFSPSPVGAAIVTITTQTRSQQKLQMQLTLHSYDVRREALLCVCVCAHARADLQLENVCGNWDQHSK